MSATPIRNKMQCNFITQHSQQSRHKSISLLKMLKHLQWARLHLDTHTQCDNSNETRCISPCISHQRCWYELAWWWWACNNNRTSL